MVDRLFSCGPSLSKLGPSAYRRHLSYVPASVQLQPCRCDISLIASTLLRLTCPELGLACRMNTWQNTFGNFLALSTGCLWLREFQIHFHTTNLGEDIKSTFASQRGAKRLGYRVKSFSANLAIFLPCCRLKVGECCRNCQTRPLWSRCIEYESMY